MSSVLVSIEGGRDAALAVKHVIELYRKNAVRIYLLNVQPPMPRYISRFINKTDLGKFHLENGMRELEPVIKQLDAAGVPHTEHVVVGQKAREIVHFAQEYHCSQIIVAKQPEAMFPSFRLGSTTSQIRQLIGSSGTSEICEDY